MKHGHPSPQLVKAAFSRGDCLYVTHSMCWFKGDSDHAAHAPTLKCTMIRPHQYSVA